MFKFSLIFILLLAISSCKKDDKNPPKGGENTIPIYNHAYQENFDADKIDDIIANAKNAYVLIDPFTEGVPEKISAIKANGNQVGGYISIGTGEDWRDDYDIMKPFLVTKQWGQWAGEYFVNETTTGILPLMKARIDKMANWGCDWVEFDNMDWTLDDKYRKDYDFLVTKSEGIAFYQDLCAYVHEKGMKCMAKNMVDGANDFDGVLYESFAKDKDWWDHAGAQSFLDAGKLVIINHYNESKPNKAYAEYVKLYNNNISFICEDKKLKKYVHFNQE